MQTPSYDATEISSALHEVQEVYLQLVEAADGMKKMMEERGWSPTAAESAALKWLNTMVEASFIRK